MSRPQTRGEEVANALSHGAGALLAAAGGGILILKAAIVGGAREVVAISIYVACLIVLYVSSAVYHTVREPVLKKRMRVVDHCSIFLLILGSYIPMALLTMGGELGWLLIAVNTLLAVVGISLKLINLNRFNKVCLILYGVMGWLALPALRSVTQVLPFAGVMLLVSGGVAYTVGIAFYTSKKRYMHFLFHLFVLAGSVLQYFCVLLYCI